MLLFDRPADSAYSQVGKFVLKTKETLWRNRKNVKDVNMVDVKVKVKVNPITGHEIPEEE